MPKRKRRVFGAQIKFRVGQIKGFEQLAGLCRMVERVFVWLEDDWKYSAVVSILPQMVMADIGWRAGKRRLEDWRLAPSRTFQT